MAPWADEIVKDFATYAETSPSGTGIKLFCIGELPTEKTGTRRPFETGVVEIYHHGRFFAVTGHIWPIAPSLVNACQSQLSDLWLRICPNRKPRPGSRGPPAATLALASDEEILRRAHRAKNGLKFTRLWNGDTDGFTSQSEADLSLCSILAFWCGPDADAIDRLFRQSGLMRDKWEREDYRSETIRKAIEGCNEFFNWNRTKMIGPQFSSNGAGAKRRNRRGLLVGDPSVPDLRESSGRTDIANARRLVLRHGDNLHWCDQWGKWLIWDDRRWAIDRELRVEALAKEIADEIWREVGRRLPELEASEHLELIRFARTTNSARGITNMLALARSEPGVPVCPEQLDRYPWLFNCPNGTIDLKTGQIKSHNRNDYLTKLCPHEYLPGAEGECPIWETTLDQILCGNHELVGFARRLFGSALIGEVVEHILPILWGAGSNGKTLIVETLQEALGDDYATKATADLLMASKGDRHPTEKADLFGKRLVMCVETDQGRHLAESVVKELTGGDTVKARRMRRISGHSGPRTRSS